MTTNIDHIRALLNEIERWEPHITVALHHGQNTHSFDDIINMVMSHRLLFFSFPECFFLTEQVQYPQCKVFHVMMAGGSIEGMEKYRDHMISVAREAGCDRISISGRKGWEKVLSRKGWLHVTTTMYLPLKEHINGQRRGNFVNSQTSARN